MRYTTAQNGVRRALLATAVGCDVRDLACESEPFVGCGDRVEVCFPPAGRGGGGGIQRTFLGYGTYENENSFGCT